MESTPVWPFWCLIAALFFLLVISNLVQDGMFVDGTGYSAISRNLAEGAGRLWNLKFSETWFSEFHEHPPLAFGLQALFFKLFGDHLFVERLYSCLTALISLIIIRKIWLASVDKKYKNLDWLPVLFWITIHVVYWSYSNNMLENTMSVFTLSAVLSIYKACKIKFYRQQYIHVFLSAIFVFLAILTKGPVALFPLGVFFAFWLAYKTITLRKMLLLSLFLTALVIGLFIAMFFIFPSSYSSLTKYFNKQIEGSFTGAYGSLPRFFVIKALLNELIPIISLITCITVYCLITKHRLNFKFDKLTLFYFLIALSASLPIAISPKQMTFYLMPSMPFYALGFASMLREFFQEIIFKLHKKNIFRLLTLILLIGSIIFSISKVGKIHPARKSLSDIYELGKVIPCNSIISVPWQLNLDWYLRAYLSRYYNISSEFSDIYHRYFITEIQYENQTPDVYTKTNLTTSKYILYERDM